MAEKPRFRRRTVFAKNLGFDVGFRYRNDTKDEHRFRLVKIAQYKMS